MRIGEVAERLGTTAHTIRRGLDICSALEPVGIRRSPATFRYDWPERGG